MKYKKGINSQHFAGVVRHTTIWFYDTHTHTHFLYMYGNYSFYVVFYQTINKTSHIVLVYSVIFDSVLSGRSEYFTKQLIKIPI